MCSSWTPTRKDDGRIYGRGAADDKGGLAVHLGMMRALDGKPPCTVKLILEGMEETNSNLEEFVESNSALFADVDLFVHPRIFLMVSRRAAVSADLTM